MSKKFKRSDLKKSAYGTIALRLSTFFMVVLLMHLFSFTAFGQTARRTVTGKVTDKAGEALIGANIFNLQTAKGDVADLDGNFSVVAGDDDVLIISYTGYVKQEIKVGNRTYIEIQLAENAELLDEVVVIGYGTAKKSDLTGAVGSVSEKQLRSSISTNIDQALQGRVAGVQVTQNSGQPGGAASIRIRGANSITGSSEPLYVIDGIPFQGDGANIAGFDWAGGANGQNRINPLSTINPSDIVSIEVLKDASATAIYGARAANGVILISTKRGKKGESKIAYNGYYAIQSLPNKLEMMKLPDFADYQLETAEEINRTPDQRYLDPSLLGSGTDWQDEVFRDAGMQSHQLSVVGGTDKTSYAVSGGYFTQDGIIIGSGFERFTARINLDNQVKDWIKVGGSLAYANTDEKITLNDGGDGVIMQALVSSPAVPVRDINGDFAGPETRFGGSDYNPVAIALQRNNTMERQRLMGNVFTDVTIIEGLTFRSEVGFDDNHSLNKAFHPTYEWGALVNTENKMRQRETSGFFWIWKNYLTYNKTFGEAHNLTAMVGSEAQKSTYQGSEVTKKNFSSNDIQVLSEGDNSTSETNGWEGASSIASYFGRFNYSFMDRYLMTLTLRADGSSKFGSANKWGYFPSGSVAWRISNEEFMSNMDGISNLKLRLGYGEVGNQAIGDYLYGSPLQTIDTPFGTAYRLSQISNPNLKWETTKQFNAGLDMSIFGDRVDLSVDIYQKQTEDMLLQLSIPSYLGGSGWDDIRAPFVNVGKMENKGIDFSIYSRNIRKDKFSWNTDLTFSLNKNLVKELDEEGKVYFRNLYWYSEFQTATMTTAGHPLGQFYGYQVEGIFSDEQDILNHAVQIQDPNSISTENPNGLNLVNKTQGVWIGDIKFKDVNGDGVVNTKDQEIIGDPNPDFTFGFNNSFTYGPFDLSVYFTGSYGADILNYSRVFIEGQTNVYSNQAATVNDRARFLYKDPNGSIEDPANVTLANPGTEMPRFTTNDNNRNNRMSDRFLEEGTFVRLQNVTFAYTVPARWTRKVRVERLRLYVNGQNLHTFTNYSGYDPEIGAFNQSPLLQNVDMGRYPAPRMVTFGIDLDF